MEFSKWSVKYTIKNNNTCLIFNQITIDLSPPHTGIVQDGVKGVPEVDYQQSTILQAHWDGFFDRESGVLFYQYGFSANPISSEEFLLDTETKLVYLYHIVK